MNMTLRHCVFELFSSTWAVMFQSGHVVIVLSVSVVGDLRSALSKMESRVSALEKRTTTPAVNGTAAVHKSTPAPQKAVSAPVKDDDEDDDIDLFGSDEEVDEEAERLKEQRLQEYAAKKAKKPALIAKSSILLDVKPVRTCSDVMLPL